MKKTLLFNLCSLALLALLAFNVTPAQARVWRIDNNTGAAADFAQGAAAIADSRVVNGDTLYFSGSTTVYSNLTVNKRLVIFGVGYYLDQNPNTQVAFSTAKVSSIDFRVGSAGSEMQGMEVTSSVNIYVSNISVRRNLGAYVYINAGTGYGATAEVNVSGIFVSQNWLSYFSTSVSGGTISNVFFTNNYVSGSGISTGTAGVTVAQNVINATGINTTSSYIYNNIMLNGGSVSGTGNSYNNNICNATQFATGNGNQQNVNMANVFVSTTTGSTDGRYMLKTGSPALGAGINGEDCGMFGGSDAYVLSGMPPIPSIWFFSQPSVVPASGALQVRLKASSHN
ncbi:hypothetical protein [Hymenobacter negativus]|uniref:Right-handed parallel beta-helix repeat-containing protein n=1 Tax=Hymenobacter negativus TaxID=2795026 RepID=A0ABS3QP81_9BACT|nr:hypothetical protein [Hymenobacter negativus]MBO2012728.1 hypothetical protein [Hymenobacter negativus]